jgi:hypothetical protein
MRHSKEMFPLAILGTRDIDYNVEIHSMYLHHHENLSWSQFYRDSFYQNHVWVRES